MGCLAKDANGTFKIDVTIASDPVLQFQLLLLQINV
jgi:hypothetical protein